MNAMKNTALLAPVALLAALALPWMVDSTHLNMAILVLMAAQLGVAWNMLGAMPARCPWGTRRSMG